MVEDRITDGKRIAQLLASEVTGLDEGPLDALSVAESDPDATPAEDGTDAYALTTGDTTVATVSMYPDHATVTFEGGVTWDERPALLEGGGNTLVVSSGAAVKRAVDAVRRARQHDQ